MDTNSQSAYLPSQNGYDPNDPYSRPYNSLYTQSGDSNKPMQSIMMIAIITGIVGLVLAISLGMAISNHYGSMAQNNAQQTSVALQQTDGR